MMAGAISMIANVITSNSLPYLGAPMIEKALTLWRLLGTIIIAPIAAGLIQMSISLTREF